jgi:hypothetical protein
MSAKRVTLLYLVTQEEYDVLKDNPHCIQYFCNNNVLVLDQLHTQTAKYIQDIRLTKTYTQKFLSGPQQQKYQYIYPYTRDYMIMEQDYDTTMELIKMSKQTTIANFYRTKIFTTIDDVRRLGLDNKYFGTQFRCSSTSHIGQLKLFLSTLQFLLYYAPINKEVHVVYPGSAEGHNLPFIMSLFPQCLWYLIDPKERGFDKQLYKHPKVKYIKKSLFNDKIVQELTKRLKGKYTLLISDIRLHEGDDKEEEITRDHLLQQGWVEMFQPTYAQLKFRPPRNVDGFKYLNGTVYLQMYAPDSSTETRLVVKGQGKLDYKTWDVVEYEDYMYQFNRILRPSFYSTQEVPPCMDHCHDCVATIRLLKEFKELRGDHIFGRLTLDKMMNTIFYNIKDTNVKRKLCLDFKEQKSNFYETSQLPNKTSKDIGDSDLEDDIKELVLLDKN